jgi:hypothetical protein
MRSRRFPSEPGTVVVEVLAGQTCLKHWAKSKEVAEF